MTRKSSPFQSRKIVPITMATTPAPRPISRQSTMGSIVRRSVVSMSGINLETMSLASIPPAVESPEPDKEEEYNPRLNGAKKTLFQAARKCDSATIVKTLEEWPNMKLNFVDEQGKTLLHHCVNAGNKNDVIVLLGRGAPINRVDNNGHTALHYAAKKDFTDIVEMLVVHGASINLPEEKTGQTALSFAVAKNYMSTAEFLLFCGANANLKDRSGKAPIAHCRSIEMRTLLANASPSSSKTRGMCLQTVQVQGGNITRCWKLEMTIDYSSGPADDKFSLMCRRQATDESPIDFHLDHTDEVFSDVFQFKLGRKGKPTALKLMIPIFALPEKNEELVLKSNKGHVIVIDSILREEHEIPLCLVKTDISTFDAFIIVARPKCEEFNVPEGGGIFSSKIYTNIAISVPVGAFSDPVTLLMQVIYPPSSDVLESKQLQNVYSSTPFCFLKEKNGIKPKVPITLFLPVPDIYGVGKELRAYHAVCDSMQLIQGNSWQPINCSVKYEQQALNIPVNCDGTSVLVETKPEVKQDVLTPEVGLLYFKSVRLEYSVAFIVMTKVEESTHSFRTVVECNTLENATKAKKSWQDEGFVDQHPLNTASFKGYSRQLYKIKVSKNLRSNEDFDGDFYVQFHIKRPNCILLSGAYKNLPNPEKGNIQVLETDRKDHFVDQEQIKSNDKHLTTLSVVMDKDPSSVPVAPRISVKEPSALEKPQVTEVKPKNTSKIKGDPSFKGFTQDDFLRMIANELDEEWYKVVVLMGWSFAEVDKVYRDGNLCQSDKILQFLLQWRDSNRTKDDLGIPALLTAFSKGGRKDLCTVVQLRMKEWLDDDSNQKTKFWRWIQKAFKDSDLINPGDYPRPMSDQFLLLLTQVECNLKIGDHLDGASDQLATMNAISDAAEYMQLKYLTKMRGHTKDQSKAFRNLLAVLKKLEMNDALRWSIMASQEWLWNTESEETPFGVELETILYDYKNISSEQKT